MIFMKTTNTNTNKYIFSEGGNIQTCLTYLIDHKSIKLQFNCQSGAKNV